VTYLDDFLFRSTRARPTSRIRPPVVVEGGLIAMRLPRSVLEDGPWERSNLPWPLWHLSESCIKVEIHLVRAYVVRGRRSVLQMDGFNKRSGANDRVRTGARGIRMKKGRESGERTVTNWTKSLGHDESAVSNGRGMNRSHSAARSSSRMRKKKKKNVDKRRVQRLSFERQKCSTSEASMKAVGRSIAFIDIPCRPKWNFVFDYRIIDIYLILELYVSM